MLFPYPSLILGLSVLGGAIPAAAQDSNAALAESLFRQGTRLSSAHRYADACPKFAERTVNLVFSAGMLVSAGLLVYFLATQSSSHEAAPSAKLQLLPVIASNGGGIEVRGTL